MIDVKTNLFLTSKSVVFGDLFYKQKQVLVVNDDNDNDNNSNETQRRQECHNEYRRIKSNQTIGLTDMDYTRSRANYGSIRRLSLFLDKLEARQDPATVYFYGGSISMGHGVEPHRDRYPDAFGTWLNGAYPLPDNKQHVVNNHARHGADVCLTAKWINNWVTPNIPDLIVLEFAVNDYQGQDDSSRIDHKTSVFYEGFEQIALCAEALVYKLLTTYPDAAIVFLEFRTSIFARKTAQLIHTGIAQHYQIPVISYADMMLPKYSNLVRHLNGSDSYTVPIGETIQPFPFGCHGCQYQHITEQFRRHGCLSLCSIMRASGIQNIDCDPNRTRDGREHCYTSFFAHDEVHASWLGHQIARDLLVELVAVTSQELCLQKYISQVDNSSTSSVIQENFIMKNFGLIGSPELLAKQTGFLMINHTTQLEPVNKSDCFHVEQDGRGRFGWFCNKPEGGEFVEFSIDLPIDQCYVIYLSAIKSYERFGKYTITLTDTTTAIVSTAEVDGLWEPRISIPVEKQINSDDNNGSFTGKGTIRITSHSEIEGRDGNKIKILEISARLCYHAKTDNDNSLNTDDPESWIII